MSNNNNIESKWTKQNDFYNDDRMVFHYVYNHSIYKRKIFHSHVAVNQHGYVQYDLPIYFILQDKTLMNLEF